MAGSSASISYITPRNPQQTVIALCTDSHFWPSGGDYFGGEGNLQLLGDTPRILTGLQRSLIDNRPDVAIHLGDFTSGGGTYAMSETEFSDALGIVTDTLQELPCATFGLPGNHDCPPGGGNWSRFEELWSLKRGGGVTIDTPHARLVLVNSQGHSDEVIQAAKPHDPVTGCVCAEELARIDEALASAGSLPVIVMMHQLLRPWAGPRPWAHYYGVENGAELLEILGRYNNVRAVFQGHAHMLDVHDAPLGDGRTCFIVTPSLVEYPIGWLGLTLTDSMLISRLCSLPFPELRERSCRSGTGQAWRSGRAEWHNLMIKLR